MIAKFQAHAPRIAMLLLLLLATARRFYQLGTQELRGDEAFGYFFSLRSFSEIVRDTIALQEPHPVASYFIQHLWLQGAGKSEFALRFTSAWWSVLAVALLYRLARRLSYSTLGASVSASMLAVSPYAIWHSQDARMYSMSLALTLASLWLALEWLQRRRTGYMVAHLVCAWLALHTHYYAVFVLAALYLFVSLRAVSSPARWNNLFEIVRVMTLLALLYLPWYLQVQSIIGRYVGNGDSPGGVEMVERTFYAFTQYAFSQQAPVRSLPYHLWIGLVCLTLVLSILHLFLSGSIQRRTLSFLLLYAGLPLLATWYASWTRPVFNERYLIAALPPFYLLLAGGCEFWIARERSSPRRKFTLSPLHLVTLSCLLVGLLLALPGHYSEASKNIGWRALAQRMDQLASGLPPQSVRLVHNFPDPVLWYYYRGPVEHLVLPPKANDRTATEQEVAGLLQSGVTRVIFSAQPAANWDADQLAESVLAQSYTAIAQTEVAHWPVQVFAQSPESLSPISITFTNGLRLSGVSVLPTQVVAGGVIGITLQWQTEQASITGQEKFSLQLLNSAGQLVAQRDEAVMVDASVQSKPINRTVGILLPSDLSVGDYRLILALYAPDQAGSPRILLADGGDHVEMTHVQVTHD